MADCHTITCLSQSVSQVPDDDDWLSPAELATQGRLKVPKRRSDWRLGRWTAKQAVKRHLRTSGPPPPLDQIAVIAADDGAPELFVHGSAAGLMLSLSHSGGYGFAAVAANSQTLGCDIERAEPRSRAFISDYFTREEQEIYRSCEPSRQAVWANLLWSAKESVAKALRQGLRLDTRSLQISDIVSEERNSGRFHACFLQEQRHFYGRWMVGQSFVRTVATSHPAPVLHIF